MFCFFVFFSKIESIEEIKGLYCVACALKKFYVAILYLISIFQPSILHLLFEGGF